MGLREFMDKFKSDGVTVFKDGVVSRPKESPNMKEYGRQGIGNATDWDKFFGLGTNNPDDLGIPVYKEMLKDAEVKTAYNFIINNIAARNWRITYPEKTSTGKNNQEVLEFLRYSFTNLDENAQFEKRVSKLLSAIVYGFSVVEIVYKIINEGRFSGKVGVKKLKDLDPTGILFETSEYGDIKKILQVREDASGEARKPISLPLDRTIVYSIDEEFGNHYGTSRLRAIYKNWFVKKTVLKFWNIALERFGMPVLIGSVPSKQDIDRMLTLLDNVQTRSSIAKTAGWEISALETGIGRSAGGDYKDAIGYHNTQIMRGLLVPPILLAGTGGGGSYALANTQFGVFQTMLKSLETDLSNIIEEKVIKPLVIFNYGAQDVYPQFVWEPMTKEDLLNLSKVFALLVKNGVVGADEQWMRDMMGVPHRDVAEVSRDTVSKPGLEKKNPPLPQIRIEQKRIQEEPKKKGSQQVKTGKTPTTGGKRVGAKGGDKTPL